MPPCPSERLSVIPSVAEESKRYFGFAQYDNNETCRFAQYDGRRFVIQSTLLSFRARFCHSIRPSVIPSAVEESKRYFDCAQYDNNETCNSAQYDNNETCNSAQYDNNATRHFAEYDGRHAPHNCTKSAHDSTMKYTTYICCAILILFGLGAAVFALTGFNLLLFCCAGNVILYRALLSLAGVSALWLLFWLIAFRPAQFLN